MKLPRRVCCIPRKGRTAEEQKFAIFASCQKILSLVDTSRESNFYHLIIVTSSLDLIDLKGLAQARRRCAAKILELYKMANAGHIGSSLSCLEILVDLCFGRMEKEDVLVLSKGHAAAALYTTLSLSDRLPETELSSFYEDGTVLSAHPPCSGAIRGIPFGTGSLGHGLGLACGIAFSCRFTGKSFKVFAVLSDGDCNEGSTWEAVLFASQQKLSDLTVVVDLNGVQGIGHTKNILNLEPIVEKWTSFGFAVAVADDGNDFGSLYRAHEAVKNSAQPRCIIARTVKGHGVSYMENRVEWHYLPMKDEQYAQALSELADPSVD
jgi:transketolase